MTPMERIRDFLAAKRFALVGVSRQPQDFSRVLWREFLARGYDAVPVNPEADEIEGHACYARLEDIQPPVNSALLMTTPAVTDTLVRSCAETGVERVWLFRGAGRGAVSPDAVQFCEAHGISVIPGECPFMYLPGGAWFHRFHGWVRKITGAWPR